MKLPVFEELELDHFDLQYLVQKFKDHKVGEAPFYIDLKCEDPVRTHDFISSLHKALLALRIDPEFPYPLIIISKAISHSEFLPVIQSITELPSHFINQTKRLKPKEQSLLNKTYILKDKIRNLDMPVIREQKVANEKLNRELFAVTSAAAFYEQLLSTLKSRVKDDRV